MEALKTKAPLPGWQDELGLLRRPAGLLLGCLAGAAMALALSHWWRSHAEQDAAAARQARSASAARLRHVAIEKEEVRQFGPRFAILQAGGMIGTENRLRWIEALKASQQRRRLFSAEVEVAPQQAVSAPSPVLLGDYHLRASRMRLQLGMLHELDLFNTLADLRAAGAYTVQSCRIRRNDVPEQAVGVARLNADCTLVWLTLGAPPAAPAAPVDKAWP